MTPFDCERLRAGWPAQPVNTISALAFVVVAVWLWRSGRRVAAILSGAVGVSSAWFHADPSGASSWAHDIALYALVALAAVELWRHWSAGERPLAAAAVLGGGLAIWFFSRTGGVLCDPGSWLQGHAMWHVFAALAAALHFAPAAQRSEATTLGR